MFLVNQSTYLGGRRDAIRKAALGYLRTYCYLIQHESDFRIAKQDHLCLVPHRVGWVAFCRFISALDQTKDANVLGRYRYGELRLSRLNFYAPFFLRKFHFEQIHGQYGDYFARLYGPIFFIFAIVSTILNSMQVGLAVDQVATTHWLSLWPAFRSFSAVVLIGAALLSLCFIILWLWLFLNDIVAIHGIGAHPDDTWCKNVGTPDAPCYVNWLTHEGMLPQAAPNARILRYGYESEWFGENAISQKTTTVADRLLLTLRRERKALLKAQYYKDEWPGIFESTTGLVFFGTPFRGSVGMKQSEMLEAAQREYNEDQIQTEVLRVLEPGNEFLQELVDSFCKTRSQANKARVTCFFEMKASNVGAVVGGQGRIRFVVNESSGCLDPSESTKNYSLSRTHFNMNKFGKPTEEDFLTVSEVIQDMVKVAPQLVIARAKLANKKHQVPFSLKGVPSVSHFVGRESEIKLLEDSVLPAPSRPRRKVYVIHGLGGIGKTQVAIEFARKHHQRYNAVFWLDGSSRDTLFQSLVDIARRLPRDELTADIAQELSNPKIDVEAVIRGVQQWLSLPSNRQWLLIFDNIDRDHTNGQDLQSYDVKDFFPDADHGSIIITSRLSNLQRYGRGSKLSIVDDEEAMTILENNADRVIQGSIEASLILDRLQGLPLALTQAGAYLRETSITLSDYIKHYNHTWDTLMQHQDEFPLQEYLDRTILTTWKMSYNQVVAQNQDAAGLLRLWAFLDHTDLWYEMVSSALQLLPELDIAVSDWLLQVARSQLKFLSAMRILSRYSLVDSREGTASHSMHAVLHKWCFLLSEGSERKDLSIAAIGMVALTVPSESAYKDRLLQRRMLPHLLYIYPFARDNRWAQWDIIDGNHQGWIFSQLAMIFGDQDKLVEAEQMYQRALQGYKKALGPDHTSTLNTVNNLGNLYSDQGKLVEAEQMYQRALQGKEKALGPDHTSTLNTVNNPISSRLRQRTSHNNTFSEHSSDTLLRNKRKNSQKENSKNKKPRRKENSKL
ncbi:hypothetical protein HYALB_00013982 [Hymenoscyphus albidus]|uniref:Orc1-like AAA ATPase domain-containing protein n=1 Tax=Hymenoscyphus albidus TaxID=595503 RepID=A0A9N9M1G6_9HELO|nr:hypothetical protein HYALB_00013982 [Hymenoscyphus albidus]